MKILLTAFLLVLATVFVPAGEFEFTYINSADGTEQKAVGYVPDHYDGKKSLPLLIVAHGMGCDRYQAKQLGYYPLAEKESFIVICPELHGLRSPGQTSICAPVAQRDVLDVLDYAKKNYNIDSKRIYIAGRSMGGMMAMLMALKHPDIFAAAVAGQGVYDLNSWLANCLPMFTKHILAEMEELPNDGNAFDYARRSPVHYAQNAPYTQIVMWHGTNDTWVPPELSESMFDAMKKANRFQTPVFYRTGASHCELNFPPEWVWEQLKTYENTPEAGVVVPTRYFTKLDYVTDEDGSIFYFDFELKDKNKFARIKSDINAGGVMNVATENLEKLSVDTRKLPKWVKDFKADIPFEIKK